MIKIRFTFIFRLIIIGLLVSNSTLSAQIFDQGKSHTSGPSEGAATCVRYSADSKIMAAGTEKGRITVRYLNYIRHTVARTIPKILRGHTAPVTDIAIHQNNNYLASTSKDGTLKIWDIKNQKVIITEKAKSRNNSSKKKPYFVFAHFSEISPNTLFFGSSEGQLYQTDITKGGIIASINTQKEHLSSFTFGHEDRRVAIGSYNSVKILDWNSKKLEKELKPCSANVISSSFSPNNELLACLCDNGMMSIWNVASGKQLKGEKVNNNKIRTELIFSDDGRYLIIGNTDVKGSSPQLWDVPNLSIVGTLEGHTGQILSLDFRPDSRQIVTAGTDAQVMTWNYREIHEPELEEVKEDTTQLVVPIPVPTPTPTPVIPNTPVPPIVTQKTVIPEEVTLEKLKLTYTHRNIPDSLGERKVTTGKKSFVRREQIEITVWDSETVDGDTISLFFNGEWLLKEYPLKKKKKKISVIVKRNADNYLVLYAHNEGERPPNTAALQIDDGGKKTRRIGLSSDLKTCDALKFEFLDN